jgi:hypothetical protein
MWQYLCLRRCLCDNNLKVAKGFEALMFKLIRSCEMGRDTATSVRLSQRHWCGNFAACAAPYEIATPVLAFDDLQNLLSDDRAIAGS